MVRPHFNRYNNGKVGSNLELLITKEINSVMFFLLQNKGEQYIKKITNLTNIIKMQDDFLY